MFSVQVQCGISCDKSSCSMSDSDIPANQGENSGEEHDALDEEIDEERARYNELRLAGLKDQVGDLKRELAFQKEENKTFNKKGHGMQYKFNTGLLKKAATARKYVENARKTKAIAAIDDLADSINKRNKDIRIADRSEYGWLTVQEYNSDDLADDSADEKELKSAEKSAKVKYEKAAERKAGGSRGKSGRFHPYGSVGVGQSGFVARGRRNFEPSATITRPAGNTATFGNAYGSASRFRSGNEVSDGSFSFDRNSNSFHNDYNNFGTGQRQQPWNNSRGRGRGRGGNGANGTNGICCFRCGEEGHYRNQCPN